MQALCSGDFTIYTSWLYATMAQKAGGVKKLREFVAARLQEMKSQGFTISGYTVRNPTDMQVANGKYYAIVPYKLTVSGPGGKRAQEMFLVGISEDGGRSWTFVDVGSMRNRNIPNFVPDLPDSLRLPPVGPPIAE
jgi:hypothetical protein